MLTLFLTAAIFYALPAHALNHDEAQQIGLNTKSDMGLTEQEKEYLKNKSELVLGYSTGFEPLFIDKSGNNYSGIVPDLYSLIAEKLGVRIRYEIGDWKTTLQKLHDSQIDIIPLMDSRIALRNGTLITGEIFEILAQVYIKKGSRFSVNSISDLNNLKVAYNKNVLILDRFFSQYKDRMQLFKTESHLDAFKLLENGKVDAVIAFNTSNYLISQHFLNDIEPVYIFKEITITSVSAVRPDNPVLHSILSKATAAITTNEKDIIGHKWLGSFIHADLPSYLTSEEREFIVRKKVLKVSNELDYEPVDFTIDGRPAGLSIDLIKMLLKDTGLKIEFVTEPAYKLFSDFENGKLDILHSIYKTDDREERGYLFSTRYLHGDLGYITHRDSPKITNIEDLFGKKVGVTKGWYTETFVSRFPQVQRVYYKNLEDKLKALSRKEIDAIINNQLEGSYYINKYGYTNLKITLCQDEQLTRISPSLHIAVPKSEPVLLSIINKALGQLPASDMQKLYEKWFGTLLGGPKDANALTPEEQDYLKKHKSFTICDRFGRYPITGVRKGKIIGVQGDIFDSIEQKLGVTFNAVKINSRADLEQKVAQGKCDMVSVQTKDSARFKDMLQTSVIYTLHLTIVGNIQSPYFREKGNFKSHIFYTANPDYLKLIKEVYPDMDIRLAGSMNDVMYEVERNSSAHYIDVQILSDNIIQIYGLNKFKQNGMLEKVKIDSAVGVSAANPELLSIMNKSIASLSPQFISETLEKYSVKEFTIVKGYAYLRYVAAGFILIAFFILYQAKQNKKITQKNRIIQQQSEELEVLFNSTPIAICFVNQKGEIVKRNDEFIKLFGYTYDKVPTLAEWFPMAYPDREYREAVISKWLQFVENAKAGNGYINTDTYFITCSDGIVRSIVVNGVLHDNGFIVAFKDVSEIVEKDQLLLKQSRLAIMGEMISMIAHQWRQPLSAIMGIMGNMYDLNQDGDINRKETESLIQKTEDILTYMSGTIDDFRNFYNQSKDKESFSILRCVYESIKMIHPQLEHNQIMIRVFIREPGMEPRQINSAPADRTGFSDENKFMIKGHSNEFQQVLLSLLSNAKDALLTIPSERTIVISIEDKNGIYEVSVKDNGTGIPQENLSKIFEPYFTTKKDLNGTGIGLYMSKMVIEKSFNGKIDVDSAIGKGAVFTLTLQPPGSSA